MDLPDFATKALQFSKASIEKGIKEYIELPQDQRPNDSWIIQTLIEGTEKLDLEKTQRVFVLFSFYQVMSANAYNLVFWIISHLLFDPELMKEMKAKIKPAFHHADKNSAPDLNYLFNSCPLLASTCEEILQLTNWSIRTQTVIEDTIVGRKKLHKGKTLLMPYRAMHFDSTVFGANAASFNPRRFMEQKTLVSNKSYQPFSGAAHYCPSQYIARREVQMFAAVMLKRFDMSPADGSTFPKMDNTLPSGGIQVPLKGEDLIIRVRPLDS